MATLNDLPNETLADILSSLSCPDLASTSRVSAHFRSTSRRLLYRAPCLRESHVTREIRAPLELFVRTLVAPGNEMLATGVRSLTFHWNSEPRPIPVSLTLLLADPSQLDVYLPVAGQDTQFLFLLYMLPSLQVLHIQRPSATFLRWLQSERTLDPRGPAGLQSLREFHCCDIDRGSIPPNALLALLQLPCIDRIDAQIRGGPVPAAYALKPVARSSCITKLRFANSHVSLAVLSPILTVPTALTHFSYAAANGGDFDIIGFMAALAPLRRTLQYLHLEPWYTVVMAPVKFEGASLRDWYALRSLSCPMVALLSPESESKLADVLPLGLREVALVAGSSWPYGEVVEQVVGMLQRKDMQVPALGKVAVVGVGDEVESAREMLEVACQTAGVRCVQEVLYW